MKKPLVLFGTGKIAEVVHYYATQVCGFEVAAFCVDTAFLTGTEFLGKPVHPFETIESTCPPSAYDMFVALGYHQMNELRKSKYEAAKAKGFHLVSIASPESTLPANLALGDNCFIMPPALIHPCVKLGNNVFVWSGALVGHHSTIGDHCWLTSSCNIGGNVSIGERTFIAMGATISHSIEIGAACFLGANTLVIKKMENEQVVIAESSKPIKLNSKQFLKFSSFSNL